EAQYLLARSYQEERQWEDAAVQWKALLKHRQAPRELGRALCNLGLCYRELKRDAEATAAWEEALQTASGEEERAAALGLAELRLDSDAAAAVSLFQRASHDINSPADWTDSLVERRTAQERFEAAWQHCLQNAQFEPA